MQTKLDTKFDFVLTASTYKSNQLAENLLRSLKYFAPAKILPIFVSPIESDLKAIANANPTIPAVYILSTINSLHFGRAWGFVWAVHNKIKSKYLITADDDIEFFPPAKDILARLNWANKEIGFSLMGFSSNHPAWASGYSRVVDCVSVGVEWLDGNCIFSNWKDNLEYGVIDGTIDVPQLYYVELEYSHRMRYLIQKPILFDKKAVYYKHVFRADPAINDLRSSNTGGGIQSGGDFWRKKFGLTFNISSEPGIHERIYQETTQEPYSENYKKFLLFGGAWNNWRSIYNDYSDKCRVIADFREFDA